MTYKTSFLLAASLVLSGAAVATSQPGAKSTATDEQAPLVFSAPPRESAAEGARIYGPIANYLSERVGRKIVYRHPGNWLSYQNEMVKGSYDLVFDGPHFNSWRIVHMQHNTLAKLAESHAFVVIVRKNDARMNELKDLSGQSVCAMSPPNLGTLAIQAQFDNPVRQPRLTPTTGWSAIYDGVASGQCTAGILPVANLDRYDQRRLTVREIFRSKVLPNQAFSAGPRVTHEEQQRIAAALLSPEGKRAVQPLLNMYASSEGLIPARKDDYAGVDAYLKTVWGFGADR